MLLLPNDYKFLNIRIQKVDGVILVFFSKEMGAVLKTSDEVVTFKAPQASAKSCFEFNQICKYQQTLLS
jgi:hypothetical protein